MRKQQEDCESPADAGVNLAEILMDVDNAGECFPGPHQDGHERSAHLTNGSIVELDQIWAMKWKFG